MAVAFENGAEEVLPQKPDTIAKSLAIGDPADGYYALRAVRESGGAVTAVSDEEIVSAIRLLARTEGIFTEPAGGVTIAALVKLASEGVVDPSELVVAYVTGHGLKTPEVVDSRAVARIPANVAGFEDALGEKEKP